MSTKISSSLNNSGSHCRPFPLIAPQAPFEESATTEASRRCPLTGFLREIGVLFSGHVLEAFATGICVLTVQNTGPELLRIGPILSVCLCVCLLSVTLFFRRLFGAGRWHYSSVFRKNHSKNGVPPGTRRRDGPFSMPPCRGRCTLPKWRLRRHPVVGLFGGDAVGNVHLWRHLPRGNRVGG